jgi:hypothetical protein
MHDETPRRRIQKLREEQSRKLRETTVQFGESLLRLRGIELPATSVDRERMAQIEAYKDLIRSETRDLAGCGKTRHLRRERVRNTETTGLDISAARVGSPRGL